MTQIIARQRHCFKTLLPVLTALACSVLLAWSPGQAEATALNDFNLIALGDLNGTSEVEGRVVVFGNIDGSSKNFAIDGSAVSDPVDTQGLNQTDGLIVGGQVNGDAIQVNNGGVRVGGSATGTQINNADYRIFNDSSVSDLLSAVTVEISDTLSMLDGLTTNSYADLSDMNSAIFTLTPGTDNIAVFDVDASLFNRGGTMDLTGDLGADLIVIRVDTSENFYSGTSLNVKTNAFSQEAYQSKIIWYLPDAETINIINGLGGALIAPKANLTFNNPIEGTVVANNITLGSEVHLPSLDSPALDIPQPDPVPEPSPLILLGLGTLVLLAAGRRRLRSKAGSAFQM